MQSHTHIDGKSPQAVYTASTSLSSTPTPRLQSNSSMRSPPASEIAALYTKLNGSSQSLTGLKTRNRDLRTEIAERRRRAMEMEERHRYCQAVVQKNEKELAVRRTARNSATDTRQRKADLLASESAHFSALKDLVQTHICAIEELGSEPPPESHSDSVVCIMLSQLRLYLGQIHQREADFLQLLTRLARDEELVESQVVALRGEIAKARNLRCSELTQTERVKRGEEMSAAAEKKRAGKSADLRVAEVRLEPELRLKQRSKGSYGEVKFFWEGKT